jgi:sigma-B regulation protein RsbU (phosphoserine phosphatase)
MEFDPTKVPDADVTLSAEEREIGGLGIYLIRQIMNTVGISVLMERMC